MRLCYQAKKEEKEERLTTEFFLENRAPWEMQREIRSDLFSSMSPLSATETQAAGVWLGGRALTGHV